MSEFKLFGDNVNNMFKSMIQRKEDDKLANLTVEELKELASKLS